MSKETRTKEKKVTKKLKVKKAFNRIQADGKVIYQNMRAFKGNRKDTNLLNINFKTRICRVLQQMHLTKQLTSQQMKASNEFKQSSPSFDSLIDLLYEQRKLINNQIKPIKKQSKKHLQQDKRNQKYHSEVDKQFVIKSPNVLTRLKRLFQSSEIMKRIYQNQGSLVNKLLMIKYVEAIRYTVIGKGQIVKWKKFRDIPQAL